MPGNYTLRKTYVDGDILSASDYVADHQQHIDNQDPQHTGDYSDNLTQMRTVTSPGDVNSESLATTLAGEVERLRYVLKDIKTKINGSAVAQWYSTSYSVVPSNGTITSAKLADGATHIQYLKTTFTPNAVLSGTDVTVGTQAITLTRTRVRVRAYFNSVATGAARPGLILSLYRGATLVRTDTFPGTANATDETYAAGAIESIDNPGPGGYTYTCKARFVNGTSTTIVNTGWMALEEVA